MLCMGPRTERLCAVVFLASFLPVASVATSRSGGVSSVQKVIQMLTDMSTKGKTDKHAEEVAFAKFSTWCTDETANLKDEIAKHQEESELLKTSIGRLGSEAESLGQAVAELQASAAEASARKKAEEAQRKSDREEYQAEARDYSESVDALERAIAVLQKQNFDRKGAEAALLQLQDRTSLPGQAQAMVAAFLGMLDGDRSSASPGVGLAYEAPEANAYEFQSGGIVGMLKKLRDEFSAKLTERQKEEMNSNHASDMVVMDLADAIDNAKRDSEERSASRQQKIEEAAKAKKRLAATTNALAETEKMLASTTAECEEKKLSFEEKQKLRAGELEAINKAVEVLNSPDVVGAAEKHLGLAQGSRGASFVQALGGGVGQGPRYKVRDFLVAEGRRLHSHNLDLLAQKLSTDPFAKVKQMIEGMITRLQEEAHSEADHKGFCDTEMGKSKLTRTRLSEEIDKFTAAAEGGKATIAALAQGTAELSKEVAELDKAMSEAVNIRKDDKATNAATIKDAKAAQAAVAAAIAVLKDFYAKALTATALLQKPTERAWGLKKDVKMGSEEWNALNEPGSTVDTGHKEGMQTFGETYQGQQDEQNGVVALLEVIQADFANLEADAQASEITDSKAHEQFMAESKKSKATKERQIQMNSADKTSAESKLQDDVADLKATQDKLLAADRYYATLEPQCMDGGMTFDERTKARGDEIASLKEALKILGGEDVAAPAE